MAIGYLIGDFDMVDVGHLDLLAQVGGLCDQVVVGVLSDNEVLRVNGRSAIVPQNERLAIVEALRGVDRAVLHETDAVPGLDGYVILAERGTQTSLSVDTWLEVRRTTASELLLALTAPAEVSAA